MKSFNSLISGILLMSAITNVSLGCSYHPVNFILILIGGFCIAIREQLK